MKVRFLPGEPAQKDKLQSNDNEKLCKSRIYTDFCLPCIQTIPAVWKKTASPDRREDNTNLSALLVTTGCEGKLSKFAERSAREPVLACIWGEVAKSADTQSPNTFTCYNGRLRKQEG